MQINARTITQPLFHSLLLAMRHFPAYNVVESVTLQITVRAGYSDARIVKEDWLSLATSFSKGSFRRLKDVKVTIHWYDWDGDQDYNFADVVKLPFKDMDLQFNFDFNPVYHRDRTLEERDYDYYSNSEPEFDADYWSD